MPKHFVQSPEWGKVKSDYGTPAIQVGDVQYTKHAIPFTNNFFGYCPKVDPAKIDFEALKASLIKNDCININFDVPNVLKGSPEESAALELFKKHKCELAPRDQFAKSNVLLDLTKDEDALFAQMHKKHRYNTKYAEKKGVTLKIAQDQKDFDAFWQLYEDTSIRQKYYIRPKSYYQKIWDSLKPLNIVHILTAEYEGTPLASWMVYTYDGVLYYPYGGSSEKHQNLFGSTFLGWQVILFGKRQHCTMFDMWGASEDPSNESDPWWGFTNFKLKFGGQHVTYMKSYDYVVNPAMYKMFSVANDLRWKVLRFIK